MTKRLACGIYKTSQPLGKQVAAGILVYYHNHGDPGPGIYLPQRWKNNRAIFNKQGITINDDYAATLTMLPREGLYRVARPFFCCANRCQRFEAETLLQLGYNGRAEPIIFLPAVIEGAFSFPAEGRRIDSEFLENLVQLVVPVAVLEQSKAPASTLN